MKKAFLLVLLATFFVQSVSAAQIASFAVEITPQTVGINQPVDLTVKAIDANWVQVMDYAGMIFIEVPDTKDFQDATLPNDWLYEFVSQDQWIKTFSKWLAFKTAGTYTVEVTDMDGAIKWQAKITVTSNVTPPISNSPITFSSPLPNTIETNNVVSVIGNTSVKNAKVQILVDGINVSEEQASANWDFTSFLSDLTPGKHTVQAQIYDINETIVGQSELLSFTYQPPQAWGIEQFDVLPSKTLKQWQKATFSVKAAKDITDVEISLSISADDKAKPIKLILDKTADGQFQKQLLMDTVGVYTIDLQYTNSKETNTVAWIAMVSVLEGKGIKQIMHVVNPIDKSMFQLSWVPIGSFDYTLIKYGIDKENLTESTLLSWSTGMIQGIDLEKNAYYVRAFPADASGKIIGEPSDIILVEKVTWTAPVCRVTGIWVFTKKIGDQYFLTWKAVDNAERYIVYRSDKPVNSVADMQKVGETSDVKFPYPFDPEAKTDAYAYYSVVAMCQDGNSAQLGDVKKVKVWPETSILIAFLLSLMIFGIYRMRKMA